MSIEGTANTEYASLSGKIRTFVIDKSLTISGACADAKATGDAIDKLIDNAEAAAEKVASDTTNKKLADFLDSTLTKNDKAAQAAAVKAAIETAIGTRAQIVVGSYAGTGTCGEDNPNVLEFDFEPKYIEIFTLLEYSSTILGAAVTSFVDRIRLINPLTVADAYTVNASGGNVAQHGKYDAGLRLNVNWGDKSVSWYAEEFDPDVGGDEPDYNTWIGLQANTSGNTYYYIAIG